MKKFFAAIAIVGVTVVSANAQVTGRVNDSGFIVVNGSGQVAAGLDFKSDAGSLLPVPASDPAPFQFMLSNTANQVTFGNLGTTVTLEGDLVTAVGYAGDPTGDLEASWGMGATPVAFSVAPAGPVVPEPASGMMAAFGLLTLLGLRRRR